MAHGPMKPRISPGILLTHLDGTGWQCATGRRKVEFFLHITCLKNFPRQRTRGPARATAGVGDAGHTARWRERANEVFTEPAIPVTPDILFRAPLGVHFVSAKRWTKTRQEIPALKSWMLSTNCQGFLSPGANASLQGRTGSQTRSSVPER